MGDIPPTDSAEAAALWDAVISAQYLAHDIREYAAAMKIKTSMPPAVLAYYLKEWADEVERELRHDGGKAMLRVSKAKG